MRLVARAPPPPILELGVRCSWLHSAACKFSIEIRAVPGGFGDLQILLQKTCLECVQNDAKILQISSQIDNNASKINKNDVRNAPGGVLEARRFQERKNVSPSFAFWRPFGATWAILGAIWDPAGRQGGVQNRTFPVKFRKK